MHLALCICHYDLLSQMRISRQGTFKYISFPSKKLVSPNFVRDGTFIWLLSWISYFQREILCKTSIKYIQIRLINFNLCENRPWITFIIFINFTRRISDKKIEEKNAWLNRYLSYLGSVSEKQHIERSSMYTGFCSIFCVKFIPSSTTLDTYDSILTLKNK